MKKLTELMARSVMLMLYGTLLLSDDNAYQNNLDETLLKQADAWQQMTKSISSLLKLIMH